MWGWVVVDGGTPNISNSFWRIAGTWLLDKGNMNKQSKHVPTVGYVLTPVATCNSRLSLRKIPQRSCGSRKVSTECVLFLLRTLAGRSDPVSFMFFATWSFLFVCFHVFFFRLGGYKQGNHEWLTSTWNVTFFIGLGRWLGNLGVDPHPHLE